MRQRTIGGLVGPFVISLALAAPGSSLLAADRQRISSSRDAIGYRGIVAANFDTVDRNEELVGDFGTLGVWVLHTGTWSQISENNPDWIFAVKTQRDPAGFDLVADFGASGLWRWDYTGYPGRWTQLTADNAEAGIAVDDDHDYREELQIDFGDEGLWRYDLDTGSWFQLTGKDPKRGVRSDLWTPGWEEGLWAFGAEGLWAVYWMGGSDGSPVWEWLSARVPDGDWVPGNFEDSYPCTEAEDEDELVGEFSGLGLWYYGSSAGGRWTQIPPTVERVLVPAEFTGGVGLVTVPILADRLNRPWYRWGGADGTLHRLSDWSMDRGSVVPFDSRPRRRGDYGSHYSTSWRLTSVFRVCGDPSTESVGPNSRPPTLSSWSAPTTKETMGDERRLWSASARDWACGCTTRGRACAPRSGTS